MKFLFDLFPVILFFAVFKIKGIFVATIAAIIASVLQIGWMLLRRKKVEPMMWAGLAIIVVFGGATVLLHDETFIKWKPTVLYWLLGTIMLSGQLFFGKNAIRAMLGKQVSLPDATWKVMNFSWGFFFVALGCVNIFVAYHFSTDTWVNFKLFGIMGLIFLFAIAQGLFIEKKMKAGASEKTEDKG
jgi:intracellular septation protein